MKRHNVRRKVLSNIRKKGKNNSSDYVYRRKEIKETEAAQKALEKEWARLRAIDCWDKTDVSPS